MEAKFLAAGDCAVSVQMERRSAWKLTGLCVIFIQI